MKKTIYNFALQIQISVIIVTFIIVYWLQSQDKYFNKKSSFDKYKLPVLSSSIVGLIINYVCETISEAKRISSTPNIDVFTEIPDF